MAGLTRTSGSKKLDAIDSRRRDCYLSVEMILNIACPEDPSDEESNDHGSTVKIQPLLSSASVAGQDGPSVG